MTVVKARVAGGWVPLNGGTGHVWNTAWGIIGVGAFVGGSNYPIPVAVTRLNPDLVVNTVVGRRYRMVLQVRLITQTTGSGVNFLPIGPGVGGGSIDLWHYQASGYGYAHMEALFVGQGSAGAYYWNANPTSAVSMFLDTMSTFYIEDVGPIAGSATMPAAPAWTSIPLSGNWVPYDPAGTSWQVPAYRKIGDVVTCRGLAKNPISSDATVGVLPAGYRPTANVMCTGWLSWNSSAGRAQIRLEISPTGVILFGTAYGLPTGTTNPAITTYDHLNLDNLTFSTT